MTIKTGIFYKIEKSQIKLKITFEKIIKWHYTGLGLLLKIMTM